MISVAVLGQPYWGGLVSRALNAPAAGVRSVFVPPRGYGRLLLRSGDSDRQFIMRVGYRTGATTARGRIFDAYWSLLLRSAPKAIACHYWLGTDVLNTLEEARAGTLRRKTIAAIRDDLHITVAPWLTSELESVGIKAITADVPVPLHAPANPPALPDDFGVLTYLPGRRFDFYGGNEILGAARCLPDVRFDIVGSINLPAEDVPSNLHLHGWVTDMPRYYANATVVVRLPHHDGMGETVVEGLLNARHVIYTHDLPHVRRISPVTTTTLVDALSEIRDAHLAGHLGLNLAGREYALAAFDEANLTARLISVIKARA
jgi:glycosyltransferase involved in cell wall biosynthesis